MGHYVQVRYVGSSVAQSASDDYVQLFVSDLPIAYRPKTVTYFMMTPANSSTGSVCILIQTDGIVKTYNFNTAVPAGCQYRVNVMYIGATFGV